MSFEFLWELVRKEGEKEFHDGNCQIELFHGGTREFPAAKVVLSSRNEAIEICDLFGNITGEHVKEIRFKISEFMKYSLGFLRFPSYFAQFCDLVKLDLEDHKLIIGDDECALFELHSLKYLRLFNCNLEFIPDKIGNFKHLEELYLGCNSITELPDRIFTLSSLNQLHVAGNAILNLSTKINNLTQLKVLWLNNNQLTSFPDITSDNMQLEILILSDNKIKKLPNTITKLKLLTKLYIHSNHLLSIPEYIDKLILLKYLDCDDNSLTFLPRSVTTLSFNHFKVSNNPLLKPPLEICEKGIDAIRGYFDALEQFTGYHSNRCKIILLGDGTAGKTSLRIALVDYKGETVDIINRTEGIDLLKWKIRLDDDKEPLEALFVDCAGQKKYIMTNQLFFTKGSLFLVIVDLWNYQLNDKCYRDTIGYWIDLILMHVYDAAIIIVPTHLDLFGKNNIKDVTERCKHILTNVWDDIMARHKLKEFNQKKKGNSHHSYYQYNISAFFHFANEVFKVCDSTVDRIEMIPVSSVGILSGISKLRESIVKVMTNRKIMPLVGRTIPKVYESFEEYCNKIKRNSPVIKIETLIKIGNSQFEMSEKMTISALLYLDTTGSVFYFTKSKELERFVFLDTEWFVNVLKAIFNHRIDFRLAYREEFKEIYGLSFENFSQHKDSLLKDAKLSIVLLRCIWHNIENISSNEDLFITLIDILHQFHLVIKFGNHNDLNTLTLVIPWFFQPASENDFHAIWPVTKDKDKVEFNSRYDSIIFPFPIGLMERFIAEVYHLFISFAPVESGFVGVMTECIIFCTIQNVDCHGEFLIRARGQNVNIIWKALIPIYKVLTNCFNEFHGDNLIEHHSVCPNCIENPCKKNLNCPQDYEEAQYALQPTPQGMLTTKDEFKLAKEIHHEKYENSDQMKPYLLPFRLLGSDQGEDETRMIYQGGIFLISQEATIDGIQSCDNLSWSRGMPSDKLPKYCKSIGCMFNIQNTEYIPVAVVYQKQSRFEDVFLKRQCDDNLIEPIDDDESFPYYLVKEVSTSLHIFHIYSPGTYHPVIRHYRDVHHFDVNSSNNSLKLSCGNYPITVNLPKNSVQCTLEIQLGLHSKPLETFLGNEGVVASPLLSIQCSCVFESPVKVTVKFPRKEVPDLPIVMSRESGMDEWVMFPEESIRRDDAVHVSFYTNHFSDFGLFQRMRKSSKNKFKKLFASKESKLLDYFSKNISPPWLCWFESDTEDGSLNTSVRRTRFECIPAHGDLNVNGFHLVDWKSAKFLPSSDDEMISVTLSDDMVFWNEIEGDNIMMFSTSARVGTSFDIKQMDHEAPVSYFYAEFPINNRRVATLRKTHSPNVDRPSLRFLTMNAKTIDLDEIYCIEGSQFYEEVGDKDVQQILDFISAKLIDGVGQERDVLCSSFRCTNSHQFSKVLDFLFEPAQDGCDLLFQELGVCVGLKLELFSSVLGIPRLATQEIQELNDNACEKGIKLLNQWIYRVAEQESKTVFALIRATQNITNNEVKYDIGDAITRFFKDDD